MGAINQYSNKSAETYGDRIAQIAEKVNSMNSTWKAAVPTKFANMEKEAIQSSMMKVEFVENKKPTKSSTLMLRLHQPQPVSIQELHGQAVNQLEKSETNLLVDHVGLSVPPKLCQTEFAFTLVKLTKPESQPLIYLLVVKNVDTDVKVVSHQVLLISG